MEYRAIRKEKVTQLAPLHEKEQRLYSTLLLSDEAPTKPPSGATLFQVLLTVILFFRSLPKLRTRGEGGNQDGPVNLELHLPLSSFFTTIDQFSDRINADTTGSLTGEQDPEILEFLH